MATKNYPEKLVFGLDIGTRSIVGTVGYKQNKDTFVAVAQCVKMHETRAMLDGQIHDINAVAETVTQVKKELEKAVGRKLTEVCIAAAGRVLKTSSARAELVFEDTRVVDDESIHSLEMLGVENAHRQLKNELGADSRNYFCVAYSVVHYYLNDFVISSLSEHKAEKIGVEVLATFLPEEVIDGLYASVNKAGLEVENITLEPIAAMQVAIPEKFRLLNIALVDVGAGTSDICITKDGTVAAYGMIPMAGDLLTETIARRFLTEFNVAEQIKTDCSTKKKSISFTDIMGINQKTGKNEVLACVEEPLTKIADAVASEIIRLNGDKPVSAVFLVGGGGKIAGFAEKLANNLSLPKERVALRGEEVLTCVEFLQEGVVKDPLLVTPIGICLHYYEQKNNFIFVRVNNERIKLYDNGKLTVVDAAMAYGLPNDKLFPSRGKELTFTVNGEKRMIRGDIGESAVITQNGKPVGLNATIQQNDEIVIQQATKGNAARATIQNLPEHKDTIRFLVNGNYVLCPRYMTVNNQMVSDSYEIADGDDIRSTDFYTLSQVLTFLDLKPEGKIYVNHYEAGKNEKVYENFSVNLEIEEEKYYKKNADAKKAEKTEKTLLKDDNFQNRPESAKSDEKQKHTETQQSQVRPADLAEHFDQLDATPLQKPSRAIGVLVNDTPVVLKGKSSYVLADVLDFYSFRLSDANGRKPIIRVNGKSTNFVEPVKEGDTIILDWKEL